MRALGAIRDAAALLTGSSGDYDPLLDLVGDARFPRWMWRNTEVVELVTWLRETELPVGFYGLDLYSLSSSIEAVIDHFDAVVHLDEATASEPLA